MSLSPSGTKKNRELPGSTLTFPTTRRDWFWTSTGDESADTSYVSIWKKYHIYNIYIYIYTRTKYNIFTYIYTHIYPSHIIYHIFSHKYIYICIIPTYSVGPYFHCNSPNGDPVDAKKRHAIDHDQHAEGNVEELRSREAPKLEVYWCLSGGWHTPLTNMS